MNNSIRKDFPRFAQHLTEAFEEADNRYNENWPRSKVVEFLQQNYELTQAEATALAIAVENTRHGAAQRALWRFRR